MDRETGYYWVHSGNEWIVAKYYADERYWRIAGSADYLYSEEFTSIDEKQITRNE